MNTKLILKGASVFLFCCILIYSCKKTDVEDNTITNPSTKINKTSLLGSDPVGPDRALPYSYPDWMANLDNTKYLSEITIPGTHDCAADLHTSEQGTETEVTIAQDFFIANQLLLGVRWFDLRLNDDGGIMTMFHGPYYLHKNFTDMVLPTLQFLTNHPTEVVVFMIKQEHSSRGDDAFANGVMGYLNWAHPDRFWMGNYVPQLSEVRGKVVIVRQFTGTHGYALGTRIMWNDNTSGCYASTDSPVYAYVQDHYSINTVNFDTKISEIENCIIKANNEPCPYRCYYLNFSSCERSPFWPLQAIAAEINPKINTFLLSGNLGHNCGVVFVNFAGGSDDGEVPDDLVKTLINMNDFNTYSVTIGTQVWMKQNLDVATYSNGDPIPEVSDPTAWQQLTTGAYCNYNNGSNDYGKLYNWFAINDPRGLAPTGWHVASNTEWSTLVNYVGGASVAAGVLKDAGTIHWWSPNTGAINQYAFTAYPGGARWGSAYGSCGETGMFWTSSATGSEAASIWMNFDNTSVQYQNYPKINGFSVRCIKD